MSPDLLYVEDLKVGPVARSTSYSLEEEEVI